MSRPRAKTIFYSVVIGSCTFFILETGWIPPTVKIIISFVGGIAVGAAAQEDSANYWESKRTINRVSDNLNQQLSGQKSVTVMRLLTLLEEMKDKT
ncbi:hypothetical protein [Limnoraphis robusta]|uniref:Holin n=1 Tax=Limnoraphis robusta CCNP1315 TaxID=3110306 RepID=A0ABU5TV16_9CYAN|nr:hypothetical protein [Limnoraphis robusta]MEA5518746.1 hypothetical protein [Limnoraphis robusta CCNP1315]MEA5544259.1 hypothetical protein [Limnoraphis robusta CCNP1324]